MLEILAKWGFPGIALFALGWYILFLHRKYGNEATKRNLAHAKERREFCKTLNKEQKLNRSAIDNNTAVLNQIKTIIEGKKK